MSARALQRVVVRMLYDPALVEAVYRDPASALADVPLTEAERGWLRAPDRRRWAVDPLRRTRGLQALLEEYPAAGAVAARRFGLPGLDGFFSSGDFHRCVQGRGSLADAFGRWLAERSQGPVAALATIERGIARVRRAPPPVEEASDGPRWSTAPWAFGAAVPGGSFAGWQRLRGHLDGYAGGALAALLDGDFDLPATPLDAAAPEGVIVERTGPAPADVVVGQGPPALGALLTRLERPHDWPETAAALQALGAGADEAAEVARSLLDDGLVTRA